MTSNTLYWRLILFPQHKDIRRHLNLNGFHIAKHHLLSIINLLQDTQSVASADNMANACAHQFRMIKSDNTLVQWICQHCRYGPHWMIWECTYCKLHLCRPCTQSA
ncbi:hypothetical protein HZ326_28556 [Fusarium oxysporum f. sp. albedinis]|nr:hypothetical protein HZ326_28556 [Fusarium oxysporum f. sp. albedinis]